MCFQDKGVCPNTSPCLKIHVFHFPFTRAAEHGFKYHSLLMGKPRGGNYHWIDNHLVKATRYNGTFGDLVKKEVTIEVFKDERS